MSFSILVSSLIFLADESHSEATPMRRRPGTEAHEELESHPPSSSKTIEDRWRLYYEGHWYDPYNTNILKGDLPLFGSQKNPWFLELGLTSDFLSEYRNIPVPVGAASTANSSQLDTFGNGRQLIIAENLGMLFSLYQGNTSFKPPNFELRFSPTFNFNHVDGDETGVLRADPATGTSRTDHHFGIQEGFIDLHLANLSERYDFISTRLGIQNFNSDFRGFVFRSSEPGIRLFGNLGNNRYQYNLAYFRRVEKDTNSGLNRAFSDRHEDVYLINLYRQDSFALGHTLQLSALHREDHAGDEGDHYNKNGFLVRPASIGDERPNSISSTYIGLSGEGHFERFNLSESFYSVFGRESHNPIAAQKTNILAWMASLEVSYDIDWIRLRSSFFWASGDDDPFDDSANGFDAIIDDPQFSGGEFSYWLRQNIPFVGGGGVNLTNRQSLLPNLRAGKEEGQSNFVNPGIRIFNLGADFELTPKWKVLSNFNFLQFDQTEAIEALRQDGSMSQNIGYDLSLGTLYRPFLNNHMQFRGGAALLIPENGFANLFGDGIKWQMFSNVVLQY